MLGALLAGIVAAGALTLSLRERRAGDTETGAPTALPSPRAASREPRTDPSAFLGAGACADCHAAQFAAWKGSTHGTAGGPPGRAGTIARFDGTPIRFNDAVVIPAAAGGAYTFTVRQAGRPDRVLRVDGVIGGGHMMGGGTQGFVSRFPDGTYRFLPFDFVKRDGMWFCNTASRTGKGWVTITPELPISACSDWPPTRVLGDAPAFENCQSCHASQLEVRFDSATRRYDTRFASLAINCESCHGPGRRHVELVRGGAPPSADVGMTALATLNKDDAMRVCWQCHALKSPLTPERTVDATTLERHYSLKLPQLGDAPFHPDGRVRTFAYQQGHLYSDCYLNGSLTCADCHDPHAQSYRDVNGARLAGRLDDRQCTGCHVSKAEPVEAHTKHPAASAGSRCVACHMPYLQHPEVGRVVRYARSDHSIPIPRPAFDAGQGIESACRACHQDRTEAQLDAAVRARWGTLKPHAPAVTALVRARAVGDRGEAARLVLDADARHPSALFAGLADFVDRFLQADMSSLERDVVARLERLAAHADPDVRAAALAGLHYARGADPAVRRFLARQLWGLGDADAPIRRRWIVVLGYLADRHRAAGEHAAALATYRKALELDPGDAQLLLNLGLAHAAAGDAQRAVESYAASLRANPGQPLAFVNLGIALAAQNDLARAAVAYRQAIEINPNEPLAYFNLANAYLQRGDAASAIPLYERATALDPGLVLARVYLARAYAATGALPRARAEVRWALEFAPTHAEALALARQLAADPR